MGCITSLIFLCNTGLIIAADVLLWMYSTTMGLFGLIGVVVFFVAHAFSTGMSLAPRDFWTNSEFDIFIKKLAFANTAALIVWGGSLIIAAMCGNEAATVFIQWAAN